MSRLTDLKIEVAPSDVASVSFALLQGHLRQLFGSAQQVIAMKMDLVLFELFSQYEKVQREAFEGGVQAKKALFECSQIMESCRDDREEIFRLSEDRLRMVKELKQVTDDSYELLQENQGLKRTAAAYEELNQLLNTRYYQMQEQLQKITKNTIGKDSVSSMQEQYNNILKDNLQIQQQIVAIGKQASRLSILVEPLKIVNIAFKSNGSLKELVMRQAEMELGNNPQLRKNFMAFQFDSNIL